MSTAVEAFLHHVLNNISPMPAAGALPQGGRWRWLADGVLLLEPADLETRAADVMLSAGVHGDETAPIELCDARVRDIARGDLPLRVRLLVALGNLDAMRAGRRYLHDDLNRMFRPRAEEAAKLRAQSRPEGAEAQRAAQLEDIARAFFLQAPACRSSLVAERRHYDLHTAIRGSQFERFALYPYRADGQWDREQLAWLAGSGIEAVLLNDGPAGTFSYFSSAEFGAHAFTLELGQARPFGHNDLTRFAGIDAALRRLLSGDLQPPVGNAAPRIFKVVHVLIKRSDAFKLHVPDDVLNFTAYPQGTVITEDGDERYVVSHPEERIVFPNRTVKNGLRAGLMVVESGLDSSTP